MWAKSISTGLFLWENCFCFLIDKLAYTSHQAQRVLAFPCWPTTKTRNTKLSVDPWRKGPGSTAANENHLWEPRPFGIGLQRRAHSREVIAADQRMLCHTKWIVEACVRVSFRQGCQWGEVLWIKLSYFELKVLQVRICSNFFSTLSSWAQPCSGPWWGIITIMMLITIREQQGPFPDHQVLSSGLIALKQHVF